MPTYPEVLSTYPAGTQACCTDVQVSAVTADDTYTLTAGKICPGRSEFNVEEGATLVTGVDFFGGNWKCYGAKLTVREPVTIDGLAYPPGALLTVDKDGHWIQVSSWTSEPGQVPAAAAVPTQPPEPGGEGTAPDLGGEVVLADSFDDNRNDWPSGSESNDYAANDWQIIGGAYRWEVQADQEMYWYVYPDSPSFADLYASVQARPVSSQGWHSYGLAFRLKDDTFYFFALNSEGEFSLRYKSEGEWGQLTDWHAGPAVQPGRSNKLAVQARGTRLSLWLNDELVAEVDDDRIRSGQVALMISMDPGSQGTFEFDDYELRRP